MKKSKKYKRYSNSQRLDFQSYAMERIKETRKAERHSTADLYRTTINWLNRYLQGKRLAFADITAGMVDRFTDFLRATGLRTNSINTYLSNFRALYNYAWRDGYQSPKTSPFQHISLHWERSGAKALKESDLCEVLSLKPTEASLKKAIDYCTFSYLACGMPFADLARLTYKNIHNNEIIYHRKKTGSLIRVGITPNMKRMIKKYASSSSPYLFPILPPTRPVKHEEYKALLRAYNHSLKTIGESLSHPLRLTSYIFRHTWASEALRKHISVTIISQALGHSSEKTTRFYLSALSQTELNKANNIITQKIETVLNNR